MRPGDRFLLPATPSPIRVLVALPVFTSASALWVFSPAFPMQQLGLLQAATGHWVQATLVLSLGAGLVQLSLVFGPGRQRPADLGWRMRTLPGALLPIFVLWLGMNLSTLLAAQPTGTPLAWNSGWQQGGLLPGALIAQLLGAALMEETVFRGWLWPQLACRLRARLSTLPAWGLALLVSQGLFAALHIPARLAAGAAPAEVAAMAGSLFLIGLVLALIYAAMRNLFFVVGLHALGNAPTLLAQPQGPPPTLVMLGLALLIAAAWAWHHARHRRKGSGVSPAYPAGHPSDATAGCAPPRP